MKPLIRYTMGKVAKAGWEVLDESLRLIKKAYPEFDIVICYNHLSEEEIIKLEKFNVPLLDQSKYLGEFNFKDNDEGKVRNFCWKLVPTRIRMNSHELWVDNDIVIRERLESIDRWLTMQTGIVSRGFNRDYGAFVNDPILMAKDACCAGFFGLPPNFNFLDAILDRTKGKAIGGFDEQGLVASVVTSFDDYIMTPKGELVLLSEVWKPFFNFWTPKALHFARSNRFDNHVCWRIYKRVTTP